MDENSIINNNDSMDINELASLNGDISPELIEQLQQKLSEEANTLKKETSEDGALFEEPNGETVISNEPKKDAKLDASFDDNFIKKYKAKLNKQKEKEDEGTEQAHISDDVFTEPKQEETQEVENNNEVISNITERKMTLEQKNYNDSLDFLDGNVKYSKYVIYIDPQNVDFIESLTVKERKNLINKILKDQDDVAVTKHNMKKFQAVLTHIIIAIVTFVISIPVIYWTINNSLEATINNYRRSQANFQTLYRDKGKISKTNQK